MRLVCWNLNHRTTMKEIPTEAVDVIDRLDADVVLLNEYTDGEIREPFKESLGRIGYDHIFVSGKIGRSNQILIASKVELHLGEIGAPDFDDSSRTNFLHVVMPSIGLGIVGLRCPAYTTRRDLENYWNELRPTIEKSIVQSIVFIGDFNGDPDGKKSPAGTHLLDLRDIGWQVPAPEGEWSYISHNGERRSRLDHLAASPEVRISGTKYITEIGGIVLAGPSAVSPISDHAALSVEVFVT